MLARPLEASIPKTLVSIAIHGFNALLILSRLHFQNSNLRISTHVRFESHPCSATTHDFLSHVRLQSYIGRKTSHSQSSYGYKRVPRLKRSQWFDCRCSNEHYHYHDSRQELDVELQHSGHRHPSNPSNHHCHFFPWRASILFIQLDHAKNPNRSPTSRVSMRSTESAILISTSIVDEVVTVTSVLQSL